jgi:hypothetical protein
MQIRILKSDSQIEPYLHTKVLGSFNHALSHVEDCCYRAEQMAEAVTFYLYRQIQHGTLGTDEIHQMILTVLESMGYAHAATALNDHRLKRKLQRKRIDVVDDALPQNHVTALTHWDKARIVRDLVGRHSIDRFLARAIASAVEEKVLNMGITKIRKSLIDQLVFADTEGMLNAHRQLTTV